MRDHNVSSMLWLLVIIDFSLAYIFKVRRTQKSFPLNFNISLFFAFRTFLEWQNEALLLHILVYDLGSDIQNP